MDSRKIETFLILAKQLSYSQTAQRLFLSQSTVSQHIKSLEDELGFPLFERSRTRVELTREGRIMEQAFQSMQHRYEKALREIVGAGTGHSVITLSHPNPLFWMNIPDFIKRFQRQYGVEVQTRLSFCGDDIPAFTAGKTDVIFTNSLRLHRLQDCEYLQAVKVPLNVVMTADHPLSKAQRLLPEELVPYDIYCAEAPEGDPCMLHLNSTILASGIDASRVHFASHRTAVLSAVATGRGLALIPANVPCGEGGRLLSIPFDAPDVGILYAAAIHSDASPLVRIFVREAVEFLKKQ